MDHFVERRVFLPNPTRQNYWIIIWVIIAFLFFLGFSLYLKWKGDSHHQITATDGQAELVVVTAQAQAQAPAPAPARPEGVDPLVRERIPQIKYDSSSSSSSVLPFNEDRCALCQHDFTDGELVSIIPSCHHSFHSPCLNHFMEQYITCPSCRKTIAAS